MGMDDMPMECKVMSYGALTMAEMPKDHEFSDSLTVEHVGSAAMPRVEQVNSISSMTGSMAQAPLSQIAHPMASLNAVAQLGPIPSVSAITQHTLSDVPSQVAQMAAVNRELQTHHVGQLDVPSQIDRAVPVAVVQSRDFAKDFGPLPSLSGLLFKDGRSALSDSHALPHLGKDDEHLQIGSITMDLSKPDAMADSERLEPLGGWGRCDVPASPSSSSSRSSCSSDDEDNKLD